MQKIAIIVAGGSGTRMGSSTPKQFLPLLGKPILYYSLKAFFDAFGNQVSIKLVLPTSAFEQGHKIAQLFGCLAANIELVAGGSERFFSVQNGINAVKLLPQQKAIILVHDAVRCLVTPQLITQCYEHAAQNGNAIPAIACVDSMRITNPNGNSIIDRGILRVIQTPQAFDANLLQAAFSVPFSPTFTDEASVVESHGTAIQLIPGETTNLKITTPIDLIIAEKILEERGA